VLEALVNDDDKLAGEQPEDPDPPVLGHGGEHLTYACQHLSYKKVRHLLEFRVVLEALVNYGDEFACVQPEDPDPPTSIFIL
jgi:hypothetical protein